MKKVLLLLIAVYCLPALYAQKKSAKASRVNTPDSLPALHAQKKPAHPIHVNPIDSLLASMSDSLEREGKRIYQAEMASWIGNDIFFDKYQRKNNIGGFFSYMANDTARCVFFSKSRVPVVIGTIDFDTSYSAAKAATSLEERPFTANETELYLIRKAAMNRVLHDTDGMFKTYENSFLNPIPIINGNKKQVYILTEPKNDGEVFFGNDYLLRLNDGDTVVSVKVLHENVVRSRYGGQGEGEAVGSMHAHEPPSSDYITPTDICTLMLYEKEAGWEQHTVISQNYVSTWDCSTNELTIVPRKVWEKANKEQLKRKRG